MSDSKTDAAPSTSSTSEDEKDRKKEIIESMSATALRNVPDRKAEIATLVTKIAELDTQISALKTSRKTLVDQKIALDDLEFDDKMKGFAGDKFLLGLHELMRRAQKAFESNDACVEYTFGPVSGRTWDDIFQTRDDLHDFYDVAREYNVRLDMHDRKRIGGLTGGYGPSTWSAMRRTV